MTSTLFLGFVAMMAAIVVGLVARYLSRRARFSVLAGLSMWFIYVGLMGYFGVVRNTAMRPPGIAFLVVPVLGFLIFFIVRFSADARVALAFPLWIILGMQCFRIGVELFLHQLWIDGLVPKMLTFEGANVDIYVGASAPLIAWLSTRGRFGMRACARLERAGPSRFDERRDSRSADGPWSVQPDPRRSPQSDAGHVPLPVYPRIFCAFSGGAARACHTGHQQPLTHGDSRMEREKGLSGSDVVVTRSSFSRTEKQMRGTY